MAKTTTDSIRAQCGPFVMIPAWLLERCPDAGAIHLYAVLQRYANRHGRAWPSRGELTEALGGISERTLKRAIAALRTVKALKTIRRHRATDGAVIGTDYLLIQVDPDPAIDDRETADLQATHGPKVVTVQEATSGPKDLARHQATTGPKDSDPLEATSGPQEKPFGPNLNPLRATGGPPYKEELDPLNQIQEQELSTAPPPTDRKPLLQVYRDAFVARFQEPPNLIAGKDAKLLQTLETTHSYERVVELLEWLFRTPDAFITGTGYTVGVFFACFNKLLVTYRAPVDAVADKHTALIEQIRSRSEKRQSELETEARAGLIAMVPKARLHLKALVVTDFGLAPFAATMAADDYDRRVKTAMVQYVVGRLKHPGETVAAALTRFAQEVAA